ncbi:MAB_1171c family putative transporter [Kitasatospora sp. NPDC127060]|uniref:MAB_1171c family putative transporter n=1 Tax=Kitasatospora sp. NPDC127060 TaxID=3347121 RepID=UPI00365F1643
MHFILYTALPVALVGIALWRTPAALHSGRAARSLCLTIGTLGLALGVSHPSLQEPLHHALANSPVLFKHLLTIASCTWLLDYLYAVHGTGTGRRQRPSLPLLAGSGTAMALIFVFLLPRSQSPKFDDVITQHMNDAWVTVYLSILYAYLGMSMIRGTGTFWGARRAVPRGLARAGVVSLAVGCVLGTAYTAIRIASLIAAQGGIIQGDAAFRPADLLVSTSILLIVTGLVLPPLRALARYLRDQATLWRLHPLWSDIVDQFPQLVLGERRSRLRELVTTGDRTIDVAHRAFVIRDGFLSLQPFAAPDAARSAAVGSDAAAQALWVRAAMKRHAAGEAAGSTDVIPEDQDLRAPRTEISWASTVARHYNKATS